jgi:hypothetical protein
MSISTPLSNQCGASEIRRNQALAISDGEVNFLWSFIQGSIMIPETWNALLRGYGFCERHAWVHLSVEMAFRKRHFLAPVILYRALIDKALRAAQAPDYVGSRMSTRRLRAGGACLLCALDVRNAGAGACSPARLDRGRDSGGLRTFAARLAPLWRSDICPICAGEGDLSSAVNHCRPHLLAEIKTQKLVDLSGQQRLLQELSGRLARYEKSFTAGGDEPSDQERAALIVAAGWCSGWRPLLELLATN